MSAKKINLLYVCSANASRSFAEEYLTKEKIQQQGLQDHFEVSSAGLVADQNPWYKVKGAHRRMVGALVSANHLAATKYNHEPRQLTSELLENADYVFCQHVGHKKTIMNEGKYSVPDLESKVWDITAFADGQDMKYIGEGIPCLAERITKRTTSKEMIRLHNSALVHIDQIVNETIDRLKAIHNLPTTTPKGEYLPALRAYNQVPLLVR